MPKKSLLLLLSFIASTALPSLLAPVAQAHVGNHESGGFLHGLQHPMGGLDHILAMLAVGLWAAQLGGAALWSLPLAFVGVMVFGGVLGMTGVTMPFVEQGILISDLVLGAIILSATRLPLTVSISIVGVLAVFHGYAHGAEMPSGASGLEYAVGFVCSTALLHLVGLSSALLTKRIGQDRLVRVAGAGVLMGGLFLSVRSFTGV
jgi:urease accessory protein